MGQITAETIAMMRRAVDAGQAPPLTLWEYTQLAWLAERQLEAAQQPEASGAGEREDPETAVLRLDTFRPVWLSHGVTMHRDVKPNEFGWIKRDDVLTALRAAIASKPPAQGAQDADAKRLHTLLKLQHAESVELWNALKDLSFECDGVTCVLPPSREVYNRTFAVLQSKLHLSPEALRGYGEVGSTQQSGAALATKPPAGEQKPVGQTYYRVRNDSDGKRVLSAFIYEDHHDLPQGTLLYTTPHDQGGSE